MTAFNTGLNNMVSWIVRLAILNIYEIFAALIGLLFFGFFPAITAVYARRRAIFYISKQKSIIYASKIMFYHVITNTKPGKEQVAGQQSITYRSSSDLKRNHLSEIFTSICMRFHKCGL